MTRGGRLQLSLAAVAVGFAAADTYVVVLALPEMMAGVEVPLDELQRAAPIVSGFLLGYVAILPLIGRIADLAGRLPVLVGSLVVFGLGSLLTAAAYDLPSLVAGRFLQGVGGGGLVPATMALVADLYPPHRRGLPLGVVGGVQELGSVLGPLYGAGVLAVGGWRLIFWLNLVVGLVLAVLLRDREVRRGPPRRDVTGTGLALGSLACAVLTLLQPHRLAEDVTWGSLLVPVTGGSRWLSPLGLAALGLAAAWVARGLTARAPLPDLRRWAGRARAADVPGAALLATALGGIVLAFATADPQVQVFSAAAPWLLLVSAAAAVGFWWRQRTARAPLLPRGALASWPARGAVAASLFVGAALVAALVDIPIYARVTAYPDSQVQAALVLVRLLAALPVGAVLGGYLVRGLPAGLVTAAGMASAAVGLGWMARWDLTSLDSQLATVPLVLAGLGFGLALAPVNGALLAATESTVHGVASAFLVVARLVGMLVGISVLTTVGLRRHYTRLNELPAPAEVCPDEAACAAYTLLVKEAGLVQLQTVFAGAAACAVVAGLVALTTFRPWAPPPTGGGAHGARE